MDLERFKKLIEDPKRSKDELLSIRANAIKKGESEFARMVEAVLDEKFPTWKQVHSKRGGSVPTDAIFKGQRCSFDSEKEAYVWLLNRFFSTYPQVLGDENTLKAYFVQQSSSPKFAKSLDELFAKSETFNGEKSKYHKLPNGWFAKLVLSNQEKLGTLMILAGLTKIPDDDWDWLPFEGDTFSGIPPLDI